MNAVDQEFTHEPEKGQYGDCQRAVIASLLDLPISEVPHFAQIAKGDSDVFWCSLQEFCDSKGYAYLTVPARCGAAFFGDCVGVYHEISGPSPRGDFWHCVVGLDGEIAFDPHPSRAGLTGDPSTWEHSYLVLKRAAA